MSGEIMLLECYHTFQLNPKSIDKLKYALQLIWDELPHNSINKVVLICTKRLRACVKAGDGHLDLEHVVNN